MRGINQLNIGSTETCLRHYGSFESVMADSKYPNLGSSIQYGEHPSYMVVGNVEMGTKWTQEHLTSSPSSQVVVVQVFNQEMFLLVAYATLVIKGGIPEAL